MQDIISADLKNRIDSFLSRKGVHSVIKTNEHKFERRDFGNTLKFDHFPVSRAI